ncbi:MAG: cytochrome c [Armatimonadota bacterium]|nr:cytochrome c [Armatimonadota bacterium]
MSLERKGLITGFTASAVSLVAVFGLAAAVRHLQGPDPMGPAGTVSPHTVTAVTLRQGENGAGKGSKFVVSALVGKHLFLANCAGCHGANGEGGMGPNLHKSAHRPDIILATVIRNGKGAMPPFKAKLRDSDVQAIIFYIHSLKQ